jgi:tetratricopeptide (TPR) repeat protein
MLTMERFWAVICALCLLAGAGCYSTEKYEVYNTGNLAFYTGDLDSAFRTYSRLLMQDSTIAQASNNRGNIYQYRDSLRLALADYAPVVFHRPTEPEGFFNRAKAFQGLRQWGNAIADYTEALFRIHKKMPELSLESLDDPNLGWLSTTIDFLKTPYGRAVKESFVNRGICNRLAWAFQAGIVDLNMAIRLDPCDPESYFQRGNCHQALALRAEADSAARHYARALDDYARCDSLLPDTGFDERVVSQEASCLLGLGRYLEASVIYDTLLATYPYKALYYFKSGNCHQAMRNYEDAYHSYTAAIMFDSTMADPYFNRGNCMYVLGQLDLAAADYSQVILLVPTYADGYYMRGITRADLGDREGAIADLSVAGELGHPYAFAEIGVLTQAVADSAKLK